MRDSLKSCADKIALPDCIPYDETIFIDADCLVYRDINNYWDCFSDASPFSVFGSEYPVHSLDGWFKKSETGKYMDSISYIPEFSGGVYYLRKGKELDSFAATSKDILDHYADYKFRFFTKPADEPIFSLAMAQYTSSGLQGINPSRLCHIPILQNVPM